MRLNLDDLGLMLLKFLKIPESLGETRSFGFIMQLWILWVSFIEVYLDLELTFLLSASSTRGALVAHLSMKKLVKLVNY